MLEEDYRRTADFQRGGMFDFRDSACEPRVEYRGKIDDEIRHILAWPAIVREIFRITDNIGDVLYCFTDFLSEIFDVFRHD